MSRKSRQIKKADVLGSPLDYVNPPETLVSTFNSTLADLFTTINPINADRLKHKKKGQSVESDTSPSSNTVSPEVEIVNDKK